MPRLIDADALVKIYKHWLPQLMKPEDAGDRNGVETCIVVLEDAPTIDAEPVTYCNMCKHYETDTGYCQYHDHGMHWDDFCSRAAKMDLEVQDV